MSQIIKHQGNSIQQVNSDVVHSGAQQFLAEWRHQQSRLANVESNQHKTIYIVGQLTRQVQQVQDSQAVLLAQQERLLNTFERTSLPDKPYQPYQGFLSRIDPNLASIIFGICLVAGLGLTIIGLAVVGKTVSNTMQTSEVQNHEILS